MCNDGELFPWGFIKPGHLLPGLMTWFGTWCNISLACRWKNCSLFSLTCVAVLLWKKPTAESHCWGLTSHYSWARTFVPWGPLSICSKHTLPTNSVVLVQMQLSSFPFRNIETFLCLFIRFPALKNVNFHELSSQIHFFMILSIWCCSLNMTGKSRFSSVFSCVP